MSESCGRARRLLGLDKGPQVVRHEAADARRHLDECTDCRTFLEEMNTLREAVRVALGNEAAPIEVREAIYGLLAEERGQQSSRRWIRWSVVAAVLAIVLAGATIVLRWPSPATPLVQQLAAEHANRLGGDRMTSQHRAEVEDWLSARVSFAVYVPELGGARLTGARICVTETGRGAIIEYAVGDRVLSYFILPSSLEDLPTGPALMSVTESGYRMVLWQDSGLAHAMVGALGEEELARLARECIEQMRDVALRAAFSVFPAT